MSTEPADNASDLNRRVATIEQTVATLQQRITVLEGDKPAVTAVSTAEAARMLGFKHRSAITTRIASGELAAYRVGTHWRVNVDSIRRYIRTAPTN